MSVPSTGAWSAPIVRMTPAQYRDRVLGGWLGKNAGSTLGTPYEGRTEPLGLAFYDPVPVQPAANDDLDLELLWLHALETHGTDLSSLQLASEWLEHMRYPWDEYAYATWNLRRGLNPPLCGHFANWFRNSMGATIRAEIWSMIAPGAPDVAAAYAYADAVLDHSGEGVWALMFLAALESAAFFVSDLDRLLQIGLSRIPSTSRIAKAIETVRSARLAGKSALEARADILREVGHSNVTDTAQNLGFIALGLLYGDGDFGASLCTAVNCGYDTDTTGATVGAILGIRGGASSLPSRWLEPIGDGVVLGWGVEGLDAPATVADLTDRTVAVGLQVVTKRCPWVSIQELPSDEQPFDVTSPDSAPQLADESAPGPEATGPQSTPALLLVEPNWLDASDSAPLLQASSSLAHNRLDSLEIGLDFGADGPTIVPEVARSVIVNLRNVGGDPFFGTVSLEAASGWRVAVPGAQGPNVRIEPGRQARLGYVVKSPADCSEANRALTLRLVSPEGSAKEISVPFVPAACWWFVGPLKNQFGGGFEHGYPVELKPALEEKYLGRDDGLVGWQRMAFGEPVLDVEPIFGGVPGVAYGMTFLRRTSHEDAKLIVHTNDGVRVWLNDRVVYQVHDHSPFRPSLCSGPGAPVRLHPGENRLLVKVVRCDQPAALAMSLLDGQERPYETWGNHRW